MTDLKIHEINGVDALSGARLESVGVHTSAELLKMGATPMGRRDLAMRTGLDESRILKWVNMADLTRIRGIGPQYSQLFEVAGVDTVNELKNRNPENLYQKIKEANDAHHIARSLPTTEQVAGFVSQATQLDPVVTY
jgi:predicted flap endonuclease-1-like 5' DNA nuclease